MTIESHPDFVFDLKHCLTLFCEIVSYEFGGLGVSAVEPGFDFGLARSQELEASSRHEDFSHMGARVR
jgi:hypothetical protein